MKCGACIMFDMSAFSVNCMKEDNWLPVSVLK